MKGSFSELAKKNKMSVADYAKMCMNGGVQKRAEGGTVDDMDENPKYPTVLPGESYSEYKDRVLKSKSNPTKFNNVEGEGEYRNKKVKPVSSYNYSPSSSLADKLKYTAPIIDPNNPEGQDVIVPEISGRNNANNPPNSGYTKPIEQENPQYTQKGNGQATPNNKNSFDYGSVLGIGQSALGAYLALKNKRPVDYIDPAFTSQLAETISRSKYGYSPEQKALLNEQAIEGRNNALQGVYNASGGNGSVALNNVRQVFNDNYKNRLENASNDEMLRLQKMGQANQMAGQQEQFHRRLFDDNMNKYSQNVNAGSALLGSGIENIINSQRYSKSRLADQQMSKYLD